MNWREQILKDFVPEVARLHIVVDPDGLLNEEAMLQILSERGFEFLRYEEPVSFRYAYETQYRLRWDKGERVELVVIAGNESSFEKLSYDLRRQGRVLRYSLGDFFPEFSYAVISQLEPPELDKLYQVRQSARPTRNLSQNNTRDYLLQNVFQIHLDQLNTPAELLRLLLQRHYTGRKLPALLDNYLIEALSRKPVFRDWPLKQILPDRAAFLAFLQGQWPDFIERWMAGKQINLDDDTRRRLAETKAIYQAQPLDLPFDNTDVRIYIDNYFVESLLQPLELATLPSLPAPRPGEPSWWIGLGLKENQAARLQSLLEKLADKTPGNHREWLEFALRWAEVNVLRQQLKEVPPAFATLQERVDRDFTDWAIRKYSSLRTITSQQPLMLHKVASYLAGFVSQSQKVALLVLDGLSLDEWLVLRDSLPRHYQYNQGAVFAWLPTLTSVSRQAIFAGKIPAEFGASLDTTNKESQHWANFWQQTAQLNSPQVLYRRSLTQLAELEEEFSNKRNLKVAGLVINTVDDMMHGTPLGTAGMYSQLRHWGESETLAGILDYLLAQNFRVWLTSDHGNIEAIGIGRPGEGSLADKRGERVRVYNDAILRNRTSQNIAGAIEWDRNGLPENYLALFAPGRTAFVPEGQKLVAHGGLSIEEVIVPLVEVSKLG